MDYFMSKNQSNQKKNCGFWKNLGVDLDFLMVSRTFQLSRIYFFGFQDKKCGFCNNLAKTWSTLCL